MYIVRNLVPIVVPNIVLWDVGKGVLAHVLALAVHLAQEMLRQEGTAALVALAVQVVVLVAVQAALLVARVDAKAVAAQAAQEDVLAVARAAVTVAVAELAKQDVKVIVKDHVAGHAKMDAKVVKEAVLIPALAVGALVKEDAMA